MPERLGDVGCQPVEAGEPVASLRDGDGPLRVRPQGQAGRAEPGALFLKPAGSVSTNAAVSVRRSESW